MNRVMNIGLAVATAGIVLLEGCAPAMPPQDLVTARGAYARASTGPAQELNPAEVHAAKQQLDVAEAAYAENGDTQDSKDQAYLALRKVELAEIHARTRQSQQSKANVVGAMHADEKATVARTSAALGESRAQLAAQGAALNAESARRAEAESRAAQAMADLAKLGSVKQESRGMVLTLSGSVLFASAKTELLPAAQQKLNDVAAALIKEDPLSKMVVEGHTDSQGGVPYNQALSQSRAQAVRDYLVSRGIAGDRITAQGFGSTRSVAENTSAEGRANNRRVEIVVQPSKPQ